MTIWDWLDRNSDAKDLIGGVLALLACAVFIRMTRDPK